MTDLRTRLRAVPTLTGTPPQFDPAQAPATPHELFVDWLLTAVDQHVPEPLAATVSTVRADGRPAVAEQTARLEADPGLVAPNWTLYTLQPDEVEFWQADPDRRHLRLRYRLTDTWIKERLWP